MSLRLPRQTCIEVSDLTEFKWFFTL